MTQTDAGTRALREHDLKCWPMFFQAIIEGRKTFELRKDDRGFEEGDVLHLREWNPNTETYTGRGTRVRVTYLALHDLSGMGMLQPGVVCMGIALLAPADAEPGYFYTDDASGRIPLSWQHVALMLRKAGYNVYAQPGFCAAPERERCNEPAPAARYGPCILRPGHGGPGAHQHDESGRIMQAFHIPRAAGLAARAEPQGGTHGE